MKTRIFLMLFIIASTRTLLAQSQLTPTRIDVSEYFEKINEYNIHIKNANRDRYTISKQISVKVLKALVYAGFGYSLYQGVYKDNVLGYVGSGVSLATILLITKPSIGDPSKSEQLSLSKAKEILEELKTGKKYN